MKTITFDNLSLKAVTLVVEPWAWAGHVAPDAQVLVHYAGDEADYVQFAINGNGDPFIAVVSADVEIVNGDVRERFTTPS